MSINGEEIGEGRRTLRTMSIIDSSVDDASLRIDRKAAILTLSSALAQSSRQVYITYQSAQSNPIQSHHTSLAYLEIRPNSFPTPNHIRNDLGTLRQRQLERLVLGKLREDVDDVVEIG